MRNGSKTSGRRRRRSPRKAMKASLSVLGTLYAKRERQADRCSGRQPRRKLSFPKGRTTVSWSKFHPTFSVYCLPPEENWIHLRISDLSRHQFLQLSAQREQRKKNTLLARLSLTDDHIEFQGLPLSEKLMQDPDPQHFLSNTWISVLNTFSMFY